MKSGIFLFFATMFVPTAIKQFMKVIRSNTGFAVRYFVGFVLTTARFPLTSVLFGGRLQKVFFYTYCSSYTYNSSNSFPVFHLPTVSRFTFFLSSNTALYNMLCQKQQNYALLIYLPDTEPCL
jgi:hypothetical protein